MKSFRLMASIDLKDILIASHVDTFDSQRINFIISIWPKVVFLGTCALCTSTKNTTKKSSPKYCNSQNNPGSQNNVHPFKHQIYFFQIRFLVYLPIPLIKNPAKRISKHLWSFPSSPIHPCKECNMFLSLTAKVCRQSKMDTSVPNMFVKWPHPE